MLIKLSDLSSHRKGMLTRGIPLLGGRRRQRGRAQARGSSRCESANRTCWLSMTYRWLTEDFSSCCSFGHMSLPGRGKMNSQRHGTALLLSDAAMRPCLSPRQATSAQIRWLTGVHSSCPPDCTSKWHSQDRKPGPSGAQAQAPRYPAWNCEE